MSRKAKRKCERRPATFKQMAVERMKEGHIRELSKELGVPVSGLYRWKQLAEGRAAPGADAAEDPRERRVRELEKKVRELEGVIGQKTLELDFFAGALRRIKESRQQRSNDGETTSTRKCAGGWKRKAD
jgi:transposase-like protein